MPSRANLQSRGGEDDEHPVRSFGAPIDRQPRPEARKARDEERRRLLEKKPTPEQRRKAIEEQQRKGREESRRRRQEAENRRTGAPKPHRRIGEPKSTYDTLKERGEDIDKEVEESQ